MASGVQQGALDQLYANRGEPHTSVVLHAWKQVGKWGAKDPTGNKKRGARTFAYLCVGIWGGLELGGRGIAAFAVRNKFSSLAARSIIQILLPKEQARKAEEGYNEARDFVAKSFDECIHGTSQCFRSLEANQSSYESHVKKATKLKIFLDENEVGQTAILIIDTIDPKLVAVLVAGILSDKSLMKAQASLGIFVSILQPILEKVAPHLANQAKPAEFIGNDGARINMQRLLLANIRNLELLDSIPLTFQQEDPFFQDHVCPITQKPIRFVKQVKTSDDDAVFYEEQAIEKWFSEKPETPPPSWPEGIAYKKEALRDCLKMQLEIDGRMKTIIEKFQEVAERVALDLIESGCQNIRNS